MIGIIVGYFLFTAFNAFAIAIAGMLIDRKITITENLIALLGPIGTIIYIISFFSWILDLNNKR